MDELFFANLNVQVNSVYHHRWRPGDALYDLPSGQYTLWLVYEGAIDIVMEQGEELRITAGQASLLPPTEGRDMRTPAGAAWYSVGMNVRLFDRLDAFAHLPVPRAWTPSLQEKEMLTVLMRALADEWQREPWHPIAPSHQPPHFPLMQPRDAASPLLRTGYGRVLFGLCWRALDRHEETGHLITRPGIPDWLGTVLEHVRREPSASLAQLAEAAGVSTVQLRRGFHKWLGTAPHEYLTRARLEEARRLLETTDWTVAVIAAHVGFDSLSYFTRLFHSRFGRPPAQYRHFSA